MTYGILQADPDLAFAMRRIASEQTERALRELDDDGLDLDEKVHQVRKRTKKLRGLIRLFRPAFPEYQIANTLLRDAARDLSKLRDTRTMINSYDSVMERFGDQIDSYAFANVRRNLTTTRDEMVESAEIPALLDRFRSTMQECNDQISTWTLEDDDFGAAAKGLGKTYKRGRKALHKARSKTTASNLHDWRKRVKYHYYHARLLQEVWPDGVRPHRVAAKELSEVLGQHHDLSVFQSLLKKEPPAAKSTFKALNGLISANMTSLETSAFDLGQLLFADPGTALVNRWSKWWSVWRVS